MQKPKATQKHINLHSSDYRLNKEQISQIAELFLLNNTGNEKARKLEWSGKWILLNSPR